MDGEMDMDVEMEFMAENAKLVDVVGDQMDMEGAGAIPLRSSLKKSSLSRTRGSVPFQKRKKVSFDSNTLQSTGGNRRARSLSPPCNKRAAGYKQKRQSEDYACSTSTLLPSMCKSAEFQGQQNSVDLQDMVDDEME